MMFRNSCILVILVCAAWGASTLSTMDSPQIEVAGVKLRGKFVLTEENERVRAFMGIPYAKPPVGELRFKSPEPPDPWVGVRLALDLPAPCVQAEKRHGEPIGKEDCLYLNVFTPEYIEKRIANETTPEPPPSMCLPVMVFFHGGGFETGSSGLSTHEYLLDADMILVSVQYRLGLLGFLSTGDTVLPGNLGLKDQRLALQWVRENIEKFGGCPEKVTIVGDGAGGASVHYHLLFAKQKNESSRAGISMSGTALSPWAFRPPSEVAHMVDSLSKITHCPRESEGFLACMRNLRPEDFVVILQKYKNETLGGCGEWALSLSVVGGVMEDPIVEDAFITANPWDKNVSMPWMVAVSGKELIYEFTEQQLVDRRKRAFPLLESCFNNRLPNALGYTFNDASLDEMVENIRNYYFEEERTTEAKSRPFINQITAFVDASFVYGNSENQTRRLNISCQPGKRFILPYQFIYIGINAYWPSALDGHIAPGHGDDIFYFFPRTLSKHVPKKSTEPDMVISKTLVTLWTNFVTHLDLSPTITPDWLKWVPIAPNTTIQSVVDIERPFYSYMMNRDDEYGVRLCMETEVPEVRSNLRNGWNPLVDAVDDGLE